MAPTTSPKVPLRSVERTLTCRELPLRLALRCVVHAAREADVELLQLSVQVGALEPGTLGHLAHVALLASEELLEVDALERLARLAQRQIEKAGRDLRR